jgi:hypothetical protein
MSASLHLEPGKQKSDQANKSSPCSIISIFHIESEPFFAINSACRVLSSLLFGDVDCHWKSLAKAQGWKSCLHDSAAERVARSLLSFGGLGHDSAAKRVAGGLGRGVLGGRHFESWG